MILLPFAKPHARQLPRTGAADWRHAAAARALELLGLCGAAVWAYRRALRRRPADTELCLRLGETLGALGRWDEAAHAFRCAARLRPRCAEAHGNLALALHRVGRDQAALEALRALSALHPRRAELHLLLATWLLRRRHPAEALRAFRAALAADPVPRSTRFFLGEALLGVEEWERLVDELGHARGLATRAHAATPRRVEARPGLRAWRRARRFPQLVGTRVTRRARALARLPLRLALQVAGRGLARAGRAPQAIRCFRRADALRPVRAAWVPSLRAGAARPPELSIEAGC